MSTISNAENGFLSLFEQVVACRTCEPAVVYSQQVMSYGDLQRRAYQFAQVLRREGVVPGAAVAVSVARTEQLIPLLLAIWSLRAAYVPIDPTFPPNRQSYVLDNSQSTLLIVDSGSHFEHSHGSIVFTHLQARADTIVDNGRLDTMTPAAEDLAYIIYTSGSTGDPKGVAVLQRGVRNFLTSMAEKPGIQCDDTLLAVTTISFDIHVLELFLPLMVGAKIILASKQQSESQACLRQLLNDYAVSFMQATPATWRVILDKNWQPQRKLKILVGGEAFPTDLLPSMDAVAGEIWNMYGPTETTVWSTCYKLNPALARVFIGHAINNTQLFVVDEHLQSVANGMEGELLIGGDGLAQGYYRREDLTADRFVTLPTGERVYRTGDLVIQHNEHGLEYVNRVDNQIKMRGYRIEPSEIEAVLHTCSGITQCIVVAAPLTASDLRLTAFFTGDVTDHSLLRDTCKRLLPTYMVPQHFIALSNFPLTDNLKVDRKSLRAMAKAFIEDSISVVAFPKNDSARDDLDRSLIAIWESLLGVRGIGIDDNFFDLGGHSLLALQLITEMVRVSGLAFELSSLFSYPTIRGCIESLGDGVHGAASVVKLNTCDVGVPVFCLCGVMIYSELAATFNNTQPVFGVFASEELQLINPTKHQPRRASFSFETLVDHYIEAILRQGNFKRIVLVGLSFGGLICLDVAKKLKARGVQTDNLYLLDTYVAESSRRSLRSICNDVLKLLGNNGFRVTLRRARLFFSRYIKGIFGQNLVSAAVRAELMDDHRAEAFDRATAVWQATNSHYDIDVVLIKASETDFGFGMRALPDYGLNQFIKGDIAVFTVCGDHTSILKGDAVKNIHAIILKTL